MGAACSADVTLRVPFIHSFITVIPISPLTNPNNASQQILHYWPDRVDALLHHALINYPTDNRKVYISGYSMGSRGAWRYITAYPGVSIVETLGSHYA